MTVLLAEPDEAVATETVAGLRGEGITIAVCASGAEALLHFGLAAPDVVLLAGRLPVVPASTVVRVLRQRVTTPVIIGIGDADAEEAAKALAAGATACIAHPYRLPELLALLLPVWHDAGDSQAVLRAGTIRLDPAAYDVKVAGRPVYLPPREFELLEYLMRRSGQVVTTEQIRRDVWGPGPGSDSNTITVHVRRLRAKLGDTPRNPTIIQTVRGRGYRITKPDDQPV
jgi:two-component system OmpR family response regulator